MFSVNLFVSDVFEAAADVEGGIRAGGAFYLAGCLAVRLPTSKAFSAAEDGRLHGHPRQWW